MAYPVARYLVVVNVVHTKVKLFQSHQVRALVLAGTFSCVTTKRTEARERAWANFDEKSTSVGSVRLK